MDIASKVITAIGVILGILGLFWVILGAVEFFQGKKNGSGEKQDSGVIQMVSGGVIVGLVSYIIPLILQKLSSLGF